MTLAVDFDVIHRYSRGWQDGAIYDPPVDGALEGLKALLKSEPVFVFTSRKVEDVAAWLLNHGLSVRVGFDGEFWDVPGRILVTNRKLPARAYLDDHAVVFTSWPQALRDLLREGSD